MTAPERIWAATPSGSGCVVSFTAPSMNYSVEYTRTDLLDAMIAEAVAKERERIAVGLATTIGAIDHGCPSCVSTACEIFNNLETGWKLAPIEDEFGNEKYSDDNDRILVSAMRAGKGE